MAVIQPSPAVHILPANNGDFLILGSASSIEGGGSLVQFVDDTQVQFPMAAPTPFVGGFQVLGMTRAQAALNFGNMITPNPLLMPIPYRQVNIGGIQQDWSMVSSGAPITQSGIILIPAHGLVTVLLVTCGSGGMMVYNTNVAGPISP